MWGLLSWRATLLDAQVFTAREIKVCGAIGPVASMDQKSAAISETEIGVRKGK